MIAMASPEHGPIKNTLETPMPYRVVNAPDGPTPPPQTWSNMKVHDNGHFHISGLVGSGTTMYEQAKETFDKARRLVEAAGGVMDDIMTMQIFVTDLDANTEIWKARREFFSGDYPCSTLIEVSRVGNPRADPKMLVEINFSGYIGASR